MVAEVVDVSMHLGSKNLLVAKVSTGAGEFRVVTNAMNIDEGMKVIFAVRFQPN